MNTFVKKFCFYGCLVPCIFLGLDFSLTHTLLSSSEKNYRVQHEIFHHSLLPNFRGYGVWGSNRYQICTGAYGNKVSCDEQAVDASIGDEFDVVFMGDSFVEGIGLPYEDTFVGQVDAALPDTSILNLAVASYSPSIYLTKIKTLWDAGLRFRHLVVFVDISDTQDEAIYYSLTSDGRVVDRQPTDLGLIQTIKRFLLSGNFSVPLALYRLTLTHEQSETLANVYELERSAWTYDAVTSGYGDIGIQAANSIAYQRMDDLYHFLNDRGVGLTVGILPWPAQLMRIEDHSDHELLWQEFCQYRCVDFVNAYPTFRSYVRSSSVSEVYNQLFIQGDVHLNALGNQLIAREIIMSLSNG